MMLNWMVNMPWKDMLKTQNAFTFALRTNIVNGTASSSPLIVPKAMRESSYYLTVRLSL